MGSLFRLTGDTVTPSAGTRVLKASEAAVLLEANASASTRPVSVCRHGAQGRGAMSGGARKVTATAWRKAASNMPRR